MPRDGSLTPADLIGKLDVLRVECGKCGRAGRYPVAKLVEKIGMDGKLTNWLYDLTKDCPRKRSPGFRGRMRRPLSRPAQRVLGFRPLAAALDAGQPSDSGKAAR